MRPGAFYLVPMTYAEQLTSVQTAIAKIESGGQAYSIAGRQLTRADLTILYDREKYLRKMVARETRGGGIRVRHCEPT